jgi:uncharacterized protein
MKPYEEKPKIGIDIDDVIFPFMVNFLKFLNKKNNTSFILQEVTSYHLWETRIQKSKEESNRDALAFQSSPDFDEINLIDGAKEILEEISDKYEIHFVTSRPEEIKEKTNSFFKKYFPENRFNILHSGEVYGGKQSKSDICIAQGISILIEDNPDYALDCARKGIRVFLIDKPWNKKYEKHENLTKVGGWNDILEVLK